MDKTKDAARLAKLTVSLTGEKDALKKAYIEPVSYTHLDVYKRQTLYYS